MTCHRSRSRREYGIIKCLALKLLPQNSTTLRLQASNAEIFRWRLPAQGQYRLMLFTSRYQSRNRGDVAYGRHDYIKPSSCRFKYANDGGKRAIGEHGGDDRR